MAITSYSPPKRAAEAAVWRMLLGGFMLEFACAGVLAFGAFSADLRDALGCSEAQLQLISSAGFVGIAFALPPGACYDRHGARPTLLAGITMATSGYGQ